LARNFSFPQTAWRKSCIKGGFKPSRDKKIFQTKSVFYRFRPESLSYLCTVFRSRRAAIGQSLNL
jgi:hypothetical protein